MVPTVLDKFPDTAPLSDKAEFTGFNSKEFFLKIKQILNKYPEMPHRCTFPFAAGASQVKKTQVTCASCMGGYCGIKLNSIASRVRSDILGLEKLRKMPWEDGIDCVACMTTTDTKVGQS